MSELPPTDLDGEDMSAGEYALGVLAANERAAVEARMAAEPAYAAAVAAWQEKLHPLSTAITPVAPPAHLWPRIAQGLGVAEPNSSKVVDLAQRRAVSFWRNWAVAASAAAAVAFVVVAVRPPPPIAPVMPAATPEPMLVAQLADPKGGGLLTATYDPGRGAMVVAPSALHIPQGRAAELWIIPADGAPRSLGVIDVSHPSTLTMPSGLRSGAKPAATLAITLEQPGGSPTGKPTTAPRWVGKLATA